MCLSQMLQFTVKMIFIILSMLIKSSDGIPSSCLSLPILMCDHCWYGQLKRTCEKVCDAMRKRIKLWHVTKWGRPWDSGSDDSQLEWSQSLKRDLSLGCFFLHLHNSLLRHIPASFISAAPDYWFVLTPAGSMQWRLWLKGCQRNMTGSLFLPLIQHQTSLHFVRQIKLA